MLIYPPTPAGDLLYVVANGDPRLYAIARRDGRIVWQMDTGDWPVSPALMDAGLLFLAGKDGALLAYRVAP